MSSLKNISGELKAHAPFTFFGTLTGIALMLAIVLFHVPRSVSEFAFWTCHPFHVLLSALVTAGMYRLHGGAGIVKTILIGYFGSVGIATVSDSLIPFAGETLIGLPNRGLHLGFIEKWWLVNPMAIAGIALAYFRPTTKFPHAGHVLLSTWASLFHIIIALGASLDAATIVLTPVFLFLAVWVPCCTSDIVFPLLFARESASKHSHEKHHQEKEDQASEPHGKALWRSMPIRFLGSWAAVFGLSGGIVCPFCGQPGCAGGMASAGVIALIVATVVSAWSRIMKKGSEKKDNNNYRSE